MTTANDLPTPELGTEPVVSLKEALTSGLPAAAIYTGLSLLAGLTFLAITLFTGDYSWVARIGGGLWVFGLCMIILMPTITPLLRRHRP